jgi:hypothetical protein
MKTSPINTATLMTSLKIIYCRQEDPRTGKTGRITTTSKIGKLYTKKKVDALYGYQNYK